MAKSQIIKELANNAISLEVALNRLYIIASDIGNDELQQWAECELHGYGDNSLPDYRYAKSTFFQYSGINGRFQVTDAPLPLLEIMKTEDPNTFYLPIHDGISTVESYVNNPNHNQVGRDLTWAAGIVRQRTGIQCYSIKQVVPVNIFEGVLNTVKMLLMKIFIKLDKTYGCLDDLDINAGSVSAEEAEETKTVINKYIYIDNSISVGDKNKMKGSGLFGGGNRNG